MIEIAKLVTSFVTYRKNESVTWEVPIDKDKKNPILLLDLGPYGSWAKPDP